MAVSVLINNYHTFLDNVGTSSIIKIRKIARVEVGTVSTIISYHHTTRINFTLLLVFYFKGFSKKKKCGNFHRRVCNDLAIEYLPFFV